MCKTWRVAPGHELTPGEIRATLEQMPRLVWLDVTGGEPFVRSDVEQVFDSVLEATPSLHVLHFQTNGWMTERVVSLVERIVARRPELQLIVTVSLDGPEATHDRVRGRDGSFVRALETFRRLRAMDGVEVYAGTTVTPFNADAIDALERTLVREVPGFEPREWHWNWLQISKHFFDNEELASLPAVDTRGVVLRHLRRRGLPRGLVDAMELLFLVNLEFVRRGEPSGVVCQALRSAAFISPEGDLYPCHVWDRPLANVRGRDVRALWASGEVRAARREVERVACGGCFTPCEAYPALAGAPIATLRVTSKRALRTIAERVVSP